MLKRKIRSGVGICDKYVRSVPSFCKKQFMAIDDIEKLHLTYFHTQLREATCNLVKYISNSILYYHVFI